MGDWRFFFFWGEADFTSFLFLRHQRVLAAAVYYYYYYYHLFIFWGLLLYFRWIVDVNCSFVVGGLWNFFFGKGLA